MKSPFEKLLYELAKKPKDFVEEYKQKIKEINEKLKKI